MLHDLLCRKQAGRGPEQQLHDLKFPPAEAGGLASAGQQTRGAVQGEVREGQDCWCIAAGAAQQCPDAAEQLVRREGLGEIIVRPSVEAFDPVVLLAPGGQQHDGAGKALGPQLPHDGKAIELGHHDI